MSCCSPLSAGMVPRLPAPAASSRGAPRAGGDGPIKALERQITLLCSLHLRGWSPALPVVQVEPALLPALAGIGPSFSASATISVSCSLHPLGWSRRERVEPEAPWLLPALAGMVPRSSTRGRRTRTAPRTRGMVPALSSHPGCGRPASRTREDGPASGGSSVSGPGCSRHPRGWSSALAPHPQDRRSAPRTRGDGSSSPVRLHAAPAPQGWSRARQHDVHRPGLLPAPAGMVPARPWTRPGGPPALCNRGDGPGPGPCGCDHERCSPHPQGWSTGPPARARIADLLPAPAGMVPDSVSWPGVTSAAPRARRDAPGPAPGAAS